MSKRNTRHSWQFAGETKGDEQRYTKWACPCGAFKIVPMTLVQDGSGTFDVEDIQHNERDH